jgi:NDP-sugar pyrophosphorylase family protein
MKTLNIVIPMGGFGSRFTKAGYTVPKPLIDVAGKPMIERVIENMRPSVPHRFIFVCQKAHFDQYDLETLFKNVAGEGMYKVVFDDILAGAAYGILLAKDYLTDNDDLLIANSDQYVETDIDDFIADGRKEGTDGLIKTFHDSDPKWSFARIDADGRVLEVAEKVPISNNATVGIYYFRRGSDFVTGAEKMIEKNLKVNGEFYVCPVYNELIADGASVRIHHIEKEKMHGLGIPEDLDTFLEKVRAGIVSL